MRLLPVDNLLLALPFDFGAAISSYHSERGRLAPGQPADVDAVCFGLVTRFVFNVNAEAHIAALQTSVLV